MEREKNYGGHAVSSKATRCEAEDSMLLNRLRKGRSWMERLQGLQKNAWTFRNSQRLWTPCGLGCEESGGWAELEASCCVLRDEAGDTRPEPGG